MFMPVVDVRHMPVSMRQRRVRMRMSVRLRTLATGVLAPNNAAATRAKNA